MDRLGISSRKKRREAADGKGKPPGGEARGPRRGRPLTARR